MIHLLIDTCSLLTMANSYGYNNYIAKLKNYVDEGLVKLYVHKLGIEEWEKNFPEDFDRKVTKLKRKQKNHESITKEHLEAQYTAIANLLTQATTLTTPGKIEDQTIERLKRRIAPFHNKVDSLNDWFIIGSFAYHCNREGIPKIYFVSKNSNEFCNTSISDEDDDSNAVLHNDLNGAFQPLEICYFVRFKTFMINIEKDIDEIKNPRKSYVRKIEWGLTSKKTIAESLDYLFNKVFFQVDYIPIDILIQYFPFTGSDQRRVYYRDGVVFGVSENLINFFNNITVNEDLSIAIHDRSLFSDIDNLDIIIKGIVSKLWDNLLYGFARTSASEIIYITPPNNILPDSRSDALKLDYFKSFSNISTSEKVCLESAYGNFKFGNFAKAYQQYKTISDQAIRDSQAFIHFASLYNQKQVAKYLKSPIINVTESINDAEIDAAKQIDLYEVAFGYRDQIEYPIMIFIASGEFFAESLEIITDSFAKLNAKFLSEKPPMWNNSSESSQILSEFRKVEYFLESNFLIFNNYSNFTRLFEYVIDGLFIANALHQSYHGQIRELDDEWAEKIIKYGRRKNLIQSWIRYKRRPLRYRRIEFNGGDILTLSSKILLLNTDKESLAPNLEQLQSDFFVNSYRYSIENVLFIFSILELDKKQIDEFCSVLITALLSNKLLSQYWIFDAVNDFLQVRVPTMKKDRAVAFFKIFSKIGFLYSEKIMMTIVEKYSGGKKLSISRTKIKSLIENTENSQGMNSFRRKLLLILLLQHVNDRSAGYIRGLIAEHVKQGDQFDNEIFSITVAMDIFEPSKDEVLEVLKSVTPKLDSIKSQDFEMNIRAKIIDDLINLCFKMNIQIPDELSLPIRMLDPYYDWLLSMEGFDYSLFKVEWLDYYETKYYRDQEAKSTRLKAHLEEILQASPNHALSRKYISMFVSS